MIDVFLFAGFVVSALWAALRCRRSELTARRDIEDLLRLTREASHAAGAVLAVESQDGAMRKWKAGIE